MDIVPSIWLSSLAGAAFFYAGGRLWPRARGPAQGAGEGATRADPDIDPEGARAALACAEAEAASAGEARDQAARALEAERARAAALEEQILIERVTAAQAGREAQQELRALRAEKEGLSGERTRLAEEKARIGAQAAEVAAQLADLRARGTTELGRTKARVSAAEARATEAEKKAAGSSAALKAKLDETTREISRARIEAAVESRQRESTLADELDRGKRELAAANARVKDLGVRLAATEAREGEADRLRAENAELRRAVATIERGRSAAPELAELQRRGAEITMKLRVLEQRAGEIARKDDEIAELSRRVEALSSAAHDAEELRRRVRELEAQSFAREAQESVPELPPSERWSEDGDAGLQLSLEAALAEVVMHEAGCRTAVLSDMRGLLIAGAGAEGSVEEIAAAAALATMVADRLQDLLPLGLPTSMAVLDGNRVVFRTRWMRYGDECFLLSTLGVRTRPLEPGADALRARLAALVFG